MRAHSPVTGSARASLSEDVKCSALTASSRVAVDHREKGAMEDDDCGLRCGDDLALIKAHLPTGSTSQAALALRQRRPGAGLTWMSCIPPDAMRCPLLGEAALLEYEGSGWLRLASRTPPHGRGATDTCLVCCGGVTRTISRPPVTGHA